MGNQDVSMIGMMVIGIFLLIGLIVIGFFLFLHYVKQKNKDANEVIANGPPRPAYNRSTSIIITAPSQYDDIIAPVKQQVRVNGETSVRQEQQNFL